MISLDEVAPDFELPGANEQGVTTYRLSDALDNGTVVLVFLSVRFPPDVYNGVLYPPRLRVDRYPTRRHSAWYQS